MAKLYLTTTEAAAALSLSKWTLIAWRKQQRGPRFVKLGAKVVYRPGDLDAFVAANTVEPAE